MKHIEEELRMSAYEDCLVQKGCVRIIPDEVRRSMIPSLCTGNGRNLPNTERRYDLFAKDAPARSFFLQLVQDTPYNITVHPKVVGNISLELKRVTLPEVLKITKDIYGYDYRRCGNNYEIFPACLQTRSFKINYIDVRRKGSSEIYVSAGTLPNSNSGTTTTSLGGGTSATQTTPGTNQLSVINSEIDSCSNSDFWNELKRNIACMVSGEGCRVEVSPMSGLLVVTAMPEELRRVEEFLRKAELTLNRQVVLEAKIMEVQLNDSYQAGINWALLLGRLRATQFGGEVVRRVIGKDESTFPTLATNLDGRTIAISPGKVGPGGTILPTFDSGTNVGHFGGVFTLAFNFKNLAAFVELLKAQGSVQVLSNPRVTAMNNQKAVIKVGSDQYFITNVSSSNVTSAFGTTTTNAFPNVQFSPFFQGVSLDVTPSIDENNEITLHIHPMIAEVEEDQKLIPTGTGTTTVPIQMARTIVRETDTVVKSKTGQVIVIGGLMKDNSAKKREGIPILKDIPYLGQVFGHTVEKKIKSELVILLRPIIVDDCAWTSMVEEEEDRFGKLDQGCGENKVSP